ncbi:MAG: DUF362 domain-containing protein [Bryobacterales bacterium]|nr:DUF362 domain-containing protein [Bryobacterales bacterium]
MKLQRRDWLIAGGVLSGAGIAGWDNLRGPLAESKLPPSPVAVIKAASYSDDLVSRIRSGVHACGLNVRGKSVLLKPNLVEFDEATSINTNVAVVAAALEVFLSMGAAAVRIAEGPGHRRDTWSLLELAGYRTGIEGFDARFTDLNRDDVSPVAGFAGEREFYFPDTALAADLIVSMAKMKTHHWAGATLSMKNLFGLVPGSVYGWPKNKLHFIGIPRSIVELNRQFRRTFAIVDGIVGMEGNGPIQGRPKPAGVLVMGRDLLAVDATCCRVMGIDPDKVEYLDRAMKLEQGPLGQIHERHIEQRGERPDAVRTDFALIDSFAGLRL